MGVLTFEDGSRYQGLFADDKMVGSNMKEIAEVRGWIDDIKKFEDTLTKTTKNFIETPNKTTKKDKTKRRQPSSNKTGEASKETPVEPDTYKIKKEIECNPYN